MKHHRNEATNTQTRIFQETGFASFCFFFFYAGHDAGHKINLALRPLLSKLPGIMLRVSEGLPGVATVVIGRWGVEEEG